MHLFSNSVSVTCVMIITKPLVMHKLVLIVFTLFSIGGFSQLNWLNTFGNIVHEELLDAATDGSGNIISAGYFSGTLTVGTTTLNTSGNSDILVMKTDNAGNAIWAVKAGGTGPDRCYSVAVDVAGNSYITGYIYNTADFGGITVTGADRDVYAAKIDPNGNFLWVKTFGGQFGDTGYGIEVDHLQNVVVTGQYKGNGVFGPDNFTSTIDPNTGQPAYDFFLTRFDASGNFVWTREANAKYDDRGMAVTVDEVGNIYVAGQFSDTITFQNMYSNTSMNAGFVVKYDIAGNEIWMDKYRAAMVMLYDIKWQADNLYLTGDFKGNMQVTHQAGTSTFSSGGSSDILIAKSNEDGNLAWFSSNYSENNISAKQLALDSNGDIYLAGLFKCDFTQMNQLYGNSTFLSLGYRDVYYIKYLNDGTFQWARQFGSNEDDYCSAIVMNTIDHPVMAGSFENWLVVPAGDSFSMSNCQSPSGPGYASNTNCSDLNYTNFCLRKSNGNKDIFICDPFDLSRLPLDYYIHNTACDYDTLKPCILDCQDTLQECANTSIAANLFHLAHESDTILHPRYDYLWNTGVTTFTQPVSATGQYDVKITREDGCSSYTDTVFVVIHPLPAAPLISDNWGYYYHSPTQAFIDTCYADSLLIEAIAGDLLATNVSWDGGIFINDSTHYIDTSGIYTATATTPFGCSAINKYNIVLDDFAIHDTLDPHIHFSDATLEATDTLYVCEDFEQTAAQLLDHNYIHALGGFPFKHSLWYLDGSYIDSVYYFPPPNDIVTLSGLTAGWHTLDAHLVNECGDSVDYFITRDFFVVIVPDPYITITGPAIFGNYCPGDTVPVYVQTDDPVVTWTGPVAGTSADTIYAVLNIANQLFTAYVDTITPHITCQASAQYTLPAYPAPQIEIVNEAINGGIVCPDDSLQLQALSGIAWAWMGPAGDTLATTQTVWVDLPGFYHCIVTDLYGCVLTSNFVEAKEYSSPVLSVDPFLICEGQTAEITVTANPLTDITWLAPLSGSSPTVIVDTAGTYYCETSFCGITAIDSVIVLLSVPVATITPVPAGPVCPGDTVTLFANGGMMNYWWNGSNEGESVFETTTAGIYVLTIENEAGCQDSDTIEIDLLSNPQPPVVSDTTICAGTAITLFAAASDSLYWFDSSGQLLGDTDSLFLPGVTAQTDIIVKNKDSLCFSLSAVITIHMGPTVPSPGPLDTTICSGNDVTLQSGSTATVTWFNADTNIVGTGPGYTTPVLFSDTVFYFELSAPGFCPVTETATITVLPNDYVPPLVWPALICENDSVVVTSGSSGVTAFSWFDNSGEINTTSSFLVPTDSAGIFSYGLVLSFGWCQSDTAFFDVAVNPLPAAGISALTPAAICPGDSVMILATTNGESLVWSPTYETDSLIAGTYEGDYFYVAELNGCYATSDTISVTFHPTTWYYEYLDTVICEGASVTLDLNTTLPVVWIDSTPDTVSITNTYTTGPLYESTEFYYQVTDTNMCPTPWTPVSITVIETGYTPDYTGISDLCLGDSVLLTSDEQNVYEYFWLNNGDTISTEPYIILVPDNSGNIYIELVTGGYGCYSDTAFISININDLPQLDLPADTTLCTIEELTINTTYDYTIDWVYNYDSLTATIDTLAVVTFTNGYGCTFTDTIQVYLTDCSLFMPNIFTPDNDGVNDMIHFSVEKGDILHLTIQNRWGQIMYDGPEAEWDGFDKTGSLCVAGTYFYVIEFRNVDESVGVEQGWFFLQR